MSRNLALARQIYKKSQRNRSRAFCKCNQENSDLCVCGEDDSNILEWKWCGDNSSVVIDGQNVIFHPVYSQGTAAIRGDRSLDKQMIHYWEIKIISNMTGTDLMIGIGTDKVNLQSCQYKYSSLLGLDNQSWGYSYRGLAQHNRRLKYYGKRYSSLCIVGVYLDLRRRFIEFYLNRRPQGIAYRQLKIDDDSDIYPMVCSTAAKSSIRLINATSFVENLQYLCVKVISKDQKSIEFLKAAPGLRHLCKKYWFLQSKEQFQYFDFVDNNSLLEDEALFCCLHEKNGQIVEKNDSSDECISDEMDIYNGMNDIRHRKRNFSNFSSDDEDFDMEFFCDHF
ncbi:SPRY domain-containing SOCS box protein 3 [Pseudolycoriella hygida]|uniref:SPRY domain-containing SOCS box protein 3 n=1 Tax=Pseudolycoriella hygida TaxID=35572 RepID=A0A9Q0NC07_9DIPT|nr:SPRY domain-containing SOCS box protein 3 [Pseudolycoriella hygida]